MTHINEITQELLNSLFSSNVRPHIQLVRDEIYSDEFNATEKALIKEISECKMSVVGIDIYHYSQFSTEKQMFIPHLFDQIYDEAWHLIKQNYVYLFQEYGDVMELDKDKNIDNKEQYISTGDGCFQILETPVHAIIFIMTFATILRFYNSDLFMRRMFSKIGPIEVRYSITWDELYKYKNNYYGASIINNSRIQSKDKLNRLLIDQNTYNWFLTSMTGIENLMIIGLNEFSSIKEFKTYNQELVNMPQNALISLKTITQSVEGIKSIDIQKIGIIKQKQTILEVYNLHMQAVIEYRSFFGKEKTIAISIGNLNSTGIQVEDS